MKQFWKLIIVGPIIIGIIVAGWITFKNQSLKLDEKNKIKNLFGNVSSKSVEITKFYTFGTSLNIEGRVKGISEDNFEGVKIILKDGKNFEKTYKLSYSFDENNVVFSTGNMINKAISLDDLPVRTILCSNTT